MSNFYGILGFISAHWSRFKPNTFVLLDTESKLTYDSVEIHALNLAGDPS